MKDSKCTVLFLESNELSTLYNMTSKLCKTIDDADGTEVRPTVTNYLRRF